MRKLAILLIINVVTLFNSNGQGIIDSIAMHTCDCVDKIENTGTLEEYQMKFGLCLLEKAQPYQVELKRDHKIDFSKSSAGKKLGEVVGMRMAFYCPETILKLANKEEKAPAAKSPDAVFSIDGKIVDLQSEQFFTLKIQTADGKMYSLLWLYFFDNSAKLMKDKSELAGKKVKIKFIEQELYDAKAKEYRKFKIIKELEME